jgi:hypothetical protein
MGEQFDGKKVTLYKSREGIKIRIFNLMNDSEPLITNKDNDTKLFGVP